MDSKKESSLSKALKGQSPGGGAQTAGPQRGPTSNRPTRVGRRAPFSHVRFHDMNVDPTPGSSITVQVDYTTAPGVPGTGFLFRDLATGANSSALACGVALEDDGTHMPTNETCLEVTLNNMPGPAGTWQWQLQAISVAAAKAQCILGALFQLESTTAGPLVYTVEYWVWFLDSTGRVKCHSFSQSQ